VRKKKSYNMAVYPSPNLLFKPFNTLEQTQVLFGHHYPESFSRQLSNQDDEVPSSKFAVSHLQTSSISSGTV